ncbi:LOW QUALITY PROTEIN: death domain-associated protein 6 [Eublepharis macularius]|uniref:Death domain-associated protein 6 n=1 Tax=Eublepharis macularius TaxID=481883 RepID=A0AA97J935_EUBMA|nr:LOW QUALITY PROTEIN: death domain-associated protein 6 [Eublepharis macularius]
MASGGGQAEVIVLDGDGDEGEEGPAQPQAQPQANGGGPPAPGKDLRAENQRLFQEFVDFCSQHTKEHPEVMPYLAARYQKASPRFVASVEFRNVLGRCLSRVQARLSKVYVYINELCTVFKAHSQKRKLVPSSSAAAEGSAASSVPSSESQAEPSKPRGGSKRQIRYLENLLQVYAVEIRRLQERELDLEELGREDSAYLQESHLKRRMMRIFERLCEFKDCNSLTGRVIEQRIPYRGTRYPEVNRRIERLINCPEAFPDYSDILKVVQKANIRHSLGLPKRQMESMAADAFRDVGNRLQERRHLDLIYNFGSHLTDQYQPGSDPALLDSELARRLRQNRQEALQRLDQVMSHYAQLQDKGEEEEWRRKRGQPPSSAASHPPGEPASPKSSEGSLSPRAARKAALQADEEEEEEEEESSSESDLEAELERSLEGSGEDEEGPAPGEDSPVQEMEADQQMGAGSPEVVLYSTDEELEEEEDEEEEEEGEEREGAPQGACQPPQLFVVEIEEALPLEASETPPPSPPPPHWTEEEGSFPLSPLPLQKMQPPVKRCRSLENTGACEVDQTSAPQDLNGQPPPRKRGKQELQVSKSSCIEVPSTGSSEDEGGTLCSPAAPLRSPAPVADSTCADSPGLDLVTSSQGSPQPPPGGLATVSKASVATQCDPEEIIVLSDSE